MDMYPKVNMIASSHVIYTKWSRIILKKSNIKIYPHLWRIPSHAQGPNTNNITLSSALHDSDAKKWKPIG